MVKVIRTNPGMNYQQTEHNAHVGQQGEVIKDGKTFDTVRWSNGKVEEVYKGDIKRI